MSKNFTRPPLQFRRTVEKQRRPLPEYGKRGTDDARVANPALTGSKSAGEDAVGLLRCLGFGDVEDIGARNAEPARQLADGNALG